MKQLDLFSEPEKDKVTPQKDDKPKKTLIIASWNVNSVRSRLNLILEWMKENKPDLLCLQEIKVQDDKFPYNEFMDLGYNSVVYGQKAYNGVAMLSAIPINKVTRGFAHEQNKKEARILTADLCFLQLITVYVPNAKSINDYSFKYKINWLNNLYNFINEKYSKDEPIIICGDFNVAPSSNDLDDPSFPLYQTFIHSAVRKEFSRILNWGLNDSFRLMHSSAGNYTWWDYRRKAFEENKGMRIDHILISDNLKQSLKRILIDKDARAKYKPSDHAPIIAEISLLKDNKIIEQMP